jgi:hypothetical protein
LTVAVQQGSADTAQVRLSRDAGAAASLAIVAYYCFYRDNTYNYILMTYGSAGRAGYLAGILYSPKA